jgi:hypothetical protein
MAQSLYLAALLLFSLFSYKSQASSVKQQAVLFKFQAASLKLQAAKIIVDRIKPVS